MLVPSSTLAGRVTVPVRERILSRRAVFPAAPCPPNATLRISATGIFAIVSSPCVSVVSGRMGRGSRGVRDPDLHRATRSTSQLFPLPGGGKRLGQGNGSFVKGPADNASGHGERRPGGRRRRVVVTPPEATTGRSTAACISAIAATFGPASMPSVAMSV